MNQRSVDAAIHAAAADVCQRYGIDPHELRIAEKGGVKGGLGNAIPVPLPASRRYLVRFHRCIREAEPLALRGLFAHELMHVRQYRAASLPHLLRFMGKYSAFSVTESLRVPVFEDWVRDLEHLTDLTAVSLGEGASIAAWKRFKADAIARGWIADSWDHMYIGAGEIEALDADRLELTRRIEACVTNLQALDALHPFTGRVT